MKAITQSMVAGLFAWALILGLPMSQPNACADSLRDQMIIKAKKEGMVVVAGSIAEDIKLDLKGFRKKYPFIKKNFLSL